MRYEGGDSHGEGQHAQQSCVGRVPGNGCVEMMRTVVVQTHTETDAGIPCVTASDMLRSRPEDSMALPSTLPPPSRKRVCQDSELKSSCSKHQQMG